MDVGFGEADEGRGRGAIGWREDKVKFKEAMTDKSGDSTEVCQCSQPSILTAWS